MTTDALDTLKARYRHNADVISDLVDEAAADFDISGPDDWTRRGLREKGFLAPVEDAPAPRM